MGLGKYLARKGAIGGTARWVADAFWGAMSNNILDVTNCSTQQGLEKEIDKVVQFALAVRFKTNPTHHHANQIYNIYKNSSSKGLVDFTISILAVEADYYKNTTSNMLMFDEVILEELRQKKVGEAIISGKTLR